MTYHCWEVDDDRNVQVLKLLKRPDTAELEDLGRVEGSASHNDLTAGLHPAELTGLGRVIASIASIHGLTMKILHPIRPGLPATLLLLMEQDPGGETVGAKSQRVKGRSMLIPGVEGLHDEVAGSVPALALVDVERDLVGSRSLIALRIGGVHVSL